MNKITALITGVGLVAILVISQMQPSQQQQTSEPTPSIETAQTGTVEADSDAKTYSFSEVSDNDSVTSCWTVIDNNVYDLTDWVQEHPGGPARILSICGTDATETFAGMHGENENAKAALDMFLIGTLSS